MQQLLQLSSREFLANLLDTGAAERLLEQQQEAHGPSSNTRQAQISSRSHPQSGPAASAAAHASAYTWCCCVGRLLPASLCSGGSGAASQQRAGPASSRQGWPLPRTLGCSCVNPQQTGCVWNAVLLGVGVSCFRDKHSQQPQHSTPYRPAELLVPHLSQGHSKQQQSAVKHLAVASGCSSRHIWQLCACCCPTVCRTRAAAVCAHAHTGALPLLPVTTVLPPPF